MAQHAAKIVMQQNMPQILLHAGPCHHYMQMCTILPIPHPSSLLSVTPVPTVKHQPDRQKEFSQD